MATRKPATSERLAQARSDLEAVEQRIRELETQRTAALLSDNDRDATALGLRIDEARQAARTITDKCALLHTAMEKEEADRREKERLARVEEVEGHIGVRDKAGAAAAAAIVALDKAFRGMFEANRKIRESWSWDAGQQAALQIGDGALVRMIEHELFRVGHRAMLFGGMDQFRPSEGPSLPGGRSPKLEWAQLPDRCQALVDELAQVSKYNMMRTGQVPIPPEPPPAAPVALAVVATNEVPGISENERKREARARRLVTLSGRSRGQLLAEQARLSEMPSTPENDQKYEDVVAELEALEDVA